MQKGLSLEKRLRILDYAQKQTPIRLSSLGLTVIKTAEQFHEAYAMHNGACNYVIQQYMRRGYTIHPIGVDLRRENVIIRDEFPDYFVEKGGETFCFDVKAKSAVEHFGWVNERAIVSYRKVSESCDVPVYIIFVQVVDGQVKGQVGYCDVLWKPKVAGCEVWDRNLIWIFDWKRGLAHVR